MSMMIVLGCTASPNEDPSLISLSLPDELPTINPIIKEHIVDDDLSHTMHLLLQQFIRDLARIDRETRDIRQITERFNHMQQQVPYAHSFAVWSDQHLLYATDTFPTSKAHTFTDQLNDYPSYFTPHLRTDLFAVSIPLDTPNEWIIGVIDLSGFNSFVTRLE